MESESTSPSTNQLAELHRAEILAHTRYPKLGAWYPPAFGAAAAVFVAGYALPIWAAMPLWVALLAVGGALARRYVDRRGTMPDWRRAPGPLKREMTLFFVAYTAGIIAIVVAWTLVGWSAGSATAFVIFTVGLTIYERRYAAAAHRAEAEAGIVS